MRALITGANSLNGTGIAPRRLQVGHEVVAFDVERTRVPAGYAFVSGGVRDFAAVANGGRSRCSGTGPEFGSADPMSSTGSPS